MSDNNKKNNWFNWLLLYWIFKPGKPWNRQHGPISRFLFYVFWFMVVCCGIYVLFCKLFGIEI